MRNRDPRRAILLVLLPPLLLTLPGCTDAESTLVEPQRSETAALYSGEDFYRGLILGSGPVASEVPLLRDHMNMDRVLRDPDMAEFIGSVQQRLIDGVRAADPTFFDRYAAAMRSGDRVRISRAFDEAARVTLSAVGEMEEIQAAREQMATDPELQQEVQTLLRSRAPAGATQQERDRAADLALAAMLGGDVGTDPYFSESVGFCLWAVVLVAATAVLVVNYAAAVQIAYAVFVVETTDLQNVADSPLLMEQVIDTVARTFII